MRPAARILSSRTGGPRGRCEALERSIICEQLDDLATGEDCLLRALESLEADPRTTTALKSALWPVCARLCQFYHSMRNARLWPAKYRRQRSPEH